MIKRFGLIRKYVSGLSLFLILSFGATDAFAVGQTSVGRASQPAVKTPKVASEITPEEVMKNVVANIKSSGAVSVGFTANAGSEQVSGTLKAAGNKFSIVTPASSVWFDGKNMWTANHSSKETTVTIPDASEIGATNPLAYLNNYASGYRLFFSKRKAPEGKWLVLLNPKKAGSGIKAVEVTVDKKSYSPERIIVRNDDDSVFRINISKIVHNAKSSAADFTYPADKLASYEVVDLR